MSNINLLRPELLGNKTIQMHTTHKKFHKRPAKIISCLNNKTIIKPVFPNTVNKSLAFDLLYLRSNTIWKSSLISRKGKISIQLFNVTIQYNWVTLWMPQVEKKEKSGGTFVNLLG